MKSTTSAPSSAALSWARFTQSPIYIHRAKGFSRILQRFAKGERYRGLGSKPLTIKDRKGILHWTLAVSVDDRPRRSSRERSADEAIKANAAPTSSLPY